MQGGNANLEVVGGVYRFQNIMNTQLKSMCKTV